MLVVIETHPIQYHAPIYRVLQQHFDVTVTAIYGSDFSVVGYEDREFGNTFAWDTDLLSGYKQVFLSRVSNGGACSAEDVSNHGLHKVLQKINPKAVLIVGYSPRFHRKAFFCARSVGYPLLFRGEVVDHARKRRIIKNLCREIFLRWFYRQFDCLLYIGKNALQHYRRLGVPKNKLIFSPYSAVTDSFQLTDSNKRELRNATRKKLGIDERKIVVLFSGKLIRHKAPDLLLKAVKRLSHSFCERIVVIFLGSGDLLDALKDMARTYSSMEVRFVGFQNQTSLSQFYHASDLLVLPSKSETWGLVVNEALHHGLPCVISNKVGCASDLIEPGITGEIFKPGSAKQLASALQRAFELIGRPEIRETCQEKVSGYTVEKAAEGISKAYWAVREHRRIDIVKRAQR